MDSKTDNVVKNFLKEVSTQIPGFSKAYLFGSHAKRKQKKDSDIDIAIVINGLNDDEKFDKQVQLLVMASNYDTRIEPHPIALEDLNSNNPFASEILNYGIELTEYAIE